MSKKEQMICEIARLYKGITVECFFRRFGSMTANELEGYVHQAKKMALKKGEQL